MRNLLGFYLGTGTRWIWHCLIEKQDMLPRKDFPSIQGAGRCELQARSRFRVLPASGAASGQEGLSCCPSGCLGSGCTFSLALAGWGRMGPRLHLPRVAWAWHCSSPWLSLVCGSCLCDGLVWGSVRQKGSPASICFFSYFLLFVESSCNGHECFLCPTCWPCRHLQQAAPSAYSHYSALYAPC